MKRRWRDITIAFIMALVLWYGVSGSDKVETQIEMRVDYRGIPHGLVVRGGMISKISVRIRATPGTISSVMGREYAYVMDLSGLRKGENVLQVDLKNVVPFVNAELLEATPSRIQLEADSLETRSIALEPDVQGDAPRDSVVQATFNPASVTLTGPSGVLSALDKLRVPIPVDAATPTGPSEFSKVLPLPEGVSAQPREVRISLHLGLKRRLVKVTRNIELNAPSTFGQYLQPEKAVITLAVPESLAARAASSQDIAAFARMEHFALGSYTLPVLVRLPEGAELVKIEPATVSVTLEQKTPPRRQSSPRPSSGAAPRPAAKPSAAKPAAKPAAPAKPAQAAKPAAGR